MKWSVRGACAALSSCLLLACALSAAAVGLKCFSLGSELKGEPFRLGTAAGAFYSGLLLAAGLSLLGSALFCCRPPDEAAAGAEGAGAAGRAGRAGSQVAAVPVSGDAAPPLAPAPPQPPKAPPGGRQNFLLLGVLVFMLGVLSAFAGAVIDGDTVSLVEKKYSHYCLLQGGAGAPLRARPAAGPPDGSAGALRCQKLRDYQRGLVISTIFNALECLLGLLNLLLVKNYKAAQRRGLRRRRRRRHQHALGAGRRRRCRGGGGGPAGGSGAGGRRPQRPSQGSIFSSEDPDLSPGGDCAFQAVSYINVGVFHVFDEAGVEVHCGGHPSIELPGYSPMDPDLNASYPYCYPLPNEQPPAYEEIYPREAHANRL
ncbi:transmembrane protein 271 [Eublepharis macularius]|uniref:Transmembrane protein 271 n=1 Tax=Eublepharis macularius TaxID=481883 RepID=A0AA97L4I1_EUBMA|nr:transmembrane protein 271 [Eublepharis macularius]